MELGSEDRGATAPISIVLLVALTVIGATTVFVFVTVIMNKDASIVERAKDIIAHGMLILPWLY